MEPISFQLGDIVALKTHPYFENLSGIVLSGDAQLISPLMIITEKLVESPKEDYSVSSLKHLYKCIWYSHKSHKFIDDWLSVDLLKLIEPNKKKLNVEELYQHVTIKTLRLELGKQKSSVIYEIAHEEKTTTSITPLLSFVSPVMQIIGIKRTEQPEPKIDNKRQIVSTRFISEYEVKCKWYNPISDKMSEMFLPSDALALMPTVSKTTIDSIQSCIDNSRYFKLERYEIRTLVKPQEILSRCGLYYLQAFDFIENKTVADIEINDEQVWASIDPYFIAKAPKFDLQVSQTPIESMTEVIEAAALRRKYIRIKYINRNNIISIRTIKEYSLSKSTDEDSPTYLIGYCCLRKEQRTFNVSKIQYFEELDLDY